MHEGDLVITIDGPAGAGKSTVARRLAVRLGVAFLDTGAMYRGVAAAALESGIDPANAEATAALAESASINFDWSSDPPRLLVNGRDLTDRLREPGVTVAAAEVAGNGRVRAVLVREQRAIGRAHRRLVTEGRDQGSVVFPDASVKFYLDASPKVRAQRRADEMQSAGKQADVGRILTEITARDRRDETRHDGPLICPEDAVRVDTSGMTLDEVVDDLTRRVRELTGGMNGGGQ